MKDLVPMKLELLKAGLIENLQDKLTWCYGMLLIEGIDLYSVELTGNINIDRYKFIYEGKYSPQQY